MNPDDEPLSRYDRKRKNLENMYFEMVKEARANGEPLYDLESWYRDEENNIYEREARIQRAIDEKEEEERWAFNRAIQLLKALPPVEGVKNESRRH